MRPYSASCGVFAALSRLLAVKPGREYLGYIDYRTLALLFCLMALVARMQEIGVFTMLGHSRCPAPTGLKTLLYTGKSLLFPAAC